jgi:N-methylhydantoinase A
MDILVGIDIGGTFTDIVGLDSKTGELTITKVPSTPKDFAKGFFHGLEKILCLTGGSPSNVNRLIHGTTVATNSIMEKKGAKIGILTTAGFEDVLIMGRQRRAEMYNLFYDPETPTFVCSRQNIMGIRERLDYKGNILTPLKEADVIEAVDFLVQKQGVQAIAVCYLFSFVDQTHEKRTEQIINDLHPGVRVSLSSAINPRFREYERMTITAFDAYVGPKMEEYIRALEEGMHRRNIGVVLQVMQSRGGITSGAMCMEKPVVTLLSGPAGGVAGGIFVGKICGRENLITMDMGGTTNDVALIQRGKPYMCLEGKIDRYPLRQPMIDITTIGAGGGSIARLDSAGGLKVGPQSAGSDPGPACYDRGGQEPTVTDSSIALGYLNPDYFGAGELTLSPDLAQKAIEVRIAKPLGVSVFEAAAGIQRIVNNNMADQIRLVSVYKGFHPRDFSLVAFGGAGPLSAGRLMQILEMKEVIIPNSPGVLSAFGLLVADIEHEEVASFTTKATEVDPNNIVKIFNQLYDRCEEKRKGVGISETELHVYRSTEMRYIGQSYELEVPFPEGKGEITKKIIQEVVKRFHDIHQGIYQHCAPDSPVEFMAFRTVFSQKPKPMPVLRHLKPGSQTSAKGQRKVYFEEYKETVDTPVYERAALVPGQKLKGVAIIEQADTTTVIYPNQVADVDNWGNLILTMTTKKT